MEIINATDQHGNNEINIRVPRDSFGEFISSLLGQRRSITHKIDDVTFTADHDWVLNVYNIIDQRLRQNSHELISLSCAVYFNNGRVVTVNNLESFKLYNDISSNECVGIYIRVSYLVQFPSKSTPEKQDISLKAFSDSNFFIAQIRNRKEKGQ